MLEISKMKMTPALSAEHQRKWDESRWECKLDDPERNYDKSRAHLNFEVRKEGVTYDFAYFAITFQQFWEKLLFDTLND